MVTSADGLTWVKNNKILIQEKNDGNKSQASPYVFYKNGKYNMFFCYWDPTTFRETKSRKIGYAYSIDFINWTRNDLKAGIDVSEEGDWDSDMKCYPNLVEVNSKFFLLYNGNEFGQYGFGVAELGGEGNDR